MQEALTPLEFLERLAQLIHPPRIHRHRYHGCWLPMPSSGIRSSRSGVRRVVWRARPQDRSTLGPSLTLRKVYQQSDAETMLQVVLDGGELGERKA